MGKIVSSAEKIRLSLFVTVVKRPSVRNAGLLIFGVLVVAMAIPRYSVKFAIPIRRSTFGEASTNRGYALKLFYAAAFSCSLIKLINRKDVASLI